MDSLLKEINQCLVCKDHLPFQPRPVVQFSPKSRLLIIGQAPGFKVQQSGIPWDDKSGDNLQNWLGVDKTIFYDPELIALIPMGFCYPGKGSDGDLPPRSECAPLWHSKLIKKMPDIKLTILVGQYAQLYYLGAKAKNTLTETIQHFKTYLPSYLPLPHPSPRNNIWQARNPWFAKQVLPVLRKKTQDILKK